MYKYTKKQNTCQKKQSRITKKRVKLHKIKKTNMIAGTNLIEKKSTIKEKYGSPILGKDLIRGNYYKVRIVRSYNGFGQIRTGNAQYFGTIYEYLIEKKGMKKEDIDEKAKKSWYTYHDVRDQPVLVFISKQSKKDNDAIVLVKEFQYLPGQTGINNQFFKQIPDLKTLAWNKLTSEDKQFVNDNYIIQKLVGGKRNLKILKG